MSQGETWSRLLVAGPSSRALTLQGFIAKWRYCAAVDPRGTLAHLLYLGYGPPTGPPAQDLFKRVPRRRVDKKVDVSSRWAGHGGKCTSSMSAQVPT
jgi:Ras family protein T1